VFQNDKDLWQPMFTTLIEQAEMRRGFVVFSKASNYAIQNELYLSVPVHGEVWDLIFEMDNYRARMLPFDPEQRQAALHAGTTFHGVVERVRDLMRAELRGAPLLDTMSVPTPDAAPPPDLIPREGGR
jgi:hypothetical protein